MGENGKLATDPSVSEILEIADDSWLFVINSDGELSRIKGSLVKNLLVGMMANATVDTVPDPDHYTRYFATEIGTYSHFLDEAGTPLVVNSFNQLSVFSFSGTYWKKINLNVDLSNFYNRTEVDGKIYLTIQKKYGKNKLDLNEITTGTFINSAGTIAANASFNVSNFIPVVEGNSYAMSQNGVAANARWVTYYDTNKAVVYSTDIQNLNTWTVPTGSSIKYQRVSYSSTYTNPQIETGSTPTAFESAYIIGQTTAGTPLKATQLVTATIDNEGNNDNSVKSKKYIDAAIVSAGLNKLSSKVVGDNLINPTIYTPGLIKSDGTIATGGANDNYNTTDFIPVVAGSTYYCLPYPAGGGVPAGNRAYCLFDSSKNLLSSFTSGSYSSVTVPAGAAFIRIGWSNSLTTPYFGLVNAASSYKAVPVNGNYELPVRKLTNATIDNEAAGDAAVLSRATILSLITASSLSAVEQISEASSNIIDPDAITNGFTLNGATGALGANADYCVSDYIPVTPGSTYSGLIEQGPNSTSQVFRKVCFYNASKVYISTTDGWLSQFTVPAGAAFVRVDSRSESWGRQNEWIGLFVGTSVTWQDFGQFISIRVKTDIAKESSSPRDLLMRSEIEDLISESAGNTTLTIENSDKILFTGCSYENSNYTLKFKNWINKLSQFTDYLCANYSIPGQRVIEIVDQLRNNNAIFAVQPKTFKPTYITIANTGNEFFPNVGQNLDLYTEQIKVANEVVASLGAKMILGTSYHVDSNPFVETQLKALAETLGIPYMGIGQIVDNITSSAYAGFWGGSHPGTRTNASTWLEWLYFIAQLPAPRKSIKIFRKRAATSSTLAALNYDTIGQRAERFVEINCGESSLKEGDGSTDYYDRLDEGTTVDPSDENNIITNYHSQVNNNEYMALMAKQNVAFTDYALIEFVLDKTNLNEVTLYVQADAGITWYLKDNNDPTLYDIQRDKGIVMQVSETVYNSFSEAVGTKFTSSLVKGGTIQFAYKGKLKSYAMGGGWFLCFTADSDVAQGNRTSSTGTIVKVSDSTNYSVTGFPIKYRYSFDYFNKLNKPKGQFVAASGVASVTYADGVYAIKLSSNVGRYMEYDKIKLLGNKSGSFNVADVYATPTGGIEKVYKPKQIESKLFGTELITTRGFDADWTTTGGWTNESNSLVSMPSGVRDYPPFLSTTNHVELGFDANGFPQRIIRTITPTVTGNNRRGFQKIVIRVIARLFPLIYNTGQTGTYYTNTPVITSTSYDLAYLCCSIGMSTGSYPHAVMRRPVDIGWSEIVFETTLPPLISAFKLSLWRDGENVTNAAYPLQVYDVSCQLI